MDNHRFHFLDNLQKIVRLLVTHTKHQVPTNTSVIYIPEWRKWALKAWHNNWFHVTVEGVQVICIIQTKILLQGSVRFERHSIRSNRTRYRIYLNMYPKINLDIVLTVGRSWKLWIYENFSQRLCQIISLDKLLSEVSLDETCQISYKPEEKQDGGKQAWCANCSPNHYAIL